MEILTFENISKKFGDNEVLNNFNLSIPKGIIYGLVGENGSGKTTTMRLILGLEKAESGVIRIFDEDVSFGETRTNRYTGYLPDVPQFYPYMTAREYLWFCGEIIGISNTELSSKINDLLAKVGLEDNKRRIAGYSRGMKQRLGIAQALLNDPELLICDEPTSALDPKGRRQLLDLIVSLKDKMTIIFSTHILGDAERICDEIGILHKGRLVEQGSLRKLKNKYSKTRIEIGFETKEKCLALEDILKNQTELQYEISEDNTMVSVHYEKNEEQIYIKVLNILLNHHLMPIRIEKQESSLENIFFEVIQ